MVRAKKTTKLITFVKVIQRKLLASFFRTQCISWCVAKSASMKNIVH